MALKRNLLKWNLIETDANLNLMCQVLNIKKATAAVMANRGIRSKNAALSYLNADMGHNVKILDGMKDAKRALDRIAKGIRQSERIMIYGDYDADGVMSTVILYKSLKMCGADVNFYIPHREEEGYGLNISAVEAIKGEDYDLIITCDNGVSALDEIAEAAGLGLDVIVIDHHEPGFVEQDGIRTDVVPAAVAVVDPKQSECSYPFKELCAAGLCFRIMDAFYQYIGRPYTIHDEMLVLAAVATVCDIVDLTGENRAIVKKGLRVFNANKNINAGLGELVKLRGYAAKPIDTFTLGFVIGPCINATGRLESAEMSVRLLISDDVNERKSLAETLSELNEERKNLTRISTDLALEKAKQDHSTVVVLIDEQVHESIAGIVAGRVKDALYRPVIVLTKAAEPGLLKGSGRSIEGYNLFEALYANQELFTRFGGHAMAAGLTLKEENAQELRKRLNEACTLQESDLQNFLNADFELPLEEVTLELANELERLAPYGKGNREPVFITRNLKINSLRVINEKNTIIFNFEFNLGKYKNVIKGIAFGLNEVFLEELGDARWQDIMLDIAHSVESNTFNGQTSVQMRVKDFRISSV